MKTHPRQANAHDALVEDLVRARYTLLACAVLARQQTQQPRHDACCPQWGGSARRSFARFRDLRKEQP
jgi:hypothetical protein